MSHRALQSRGGILSLGVSGRALLHLAGDCAFPCACQRNAFVKCLEWYERLPRYFDELARRIPPFSTAAEAVWHHRRKHSCAT